MLAFNLFSYLFVVRNTKENLLNKIMTELRNINDENLLVEIFLELFDYLKTKEPFYFESYLTVLERIFHVPFKQTECKNLIDFCYQFFYQVLLKTKERNQSSLIESLVSIFFKAEIEKFSKRIFTFLEAVKKDELSVFDFNQIFQIKILKRQIKKS